ncbi:MAG: transglycosylase domain-containing protein [Candidatus Gracilibacteria bacterium]|nr:transglycosylase domain-containing protein [Candidatus Gracilibacteria bacterium]
MKKSKILVFSFLILIGIYFIFPYFIKVEIKKIPTSTIILDENGNELGEIIAKEKYRHIEKKLNEFPEFLKKSIVKVEDKRFYLHSGIDYIGIIRALKNNIFGGNMQGASTIENQIIRNNYWLNQKRDYLLKLKEYFLALALDKKYSKDEILEIYLNNINFGYLNYGAESASRFYYKKSLNNLTKAEIIGLITIIKNPNKYNPITNLSNFNSRFKILVNNLYENKVITKSQKDEILAEKLTFYKGQKNSLPYIVDFIKNSQKEIKNDGKIITTINYNLTKKIDELAKTSLKSLAWKNVGDYGIIIIDKKTMDLKVMIGGNNYYAENGQVNGSLALRQPGSALKPFLYTLAFQNLAKTPSSTILDLPVSYPTSDGNIYEPKNYSLNYAGEITLAEALSQSINIPAVKLLNDIGINNFMIFLKAVGITSLNKDSDFYGLSLALGSPEVSLYELTRAYGIFANNGDFCDVNFINLPLSPIFKNIEKQKSSCKKIIKEKYIKMVQEILTNRYFKLAGFPINSNLDFPDREVFVKTGTSRNFRDNWALGYTNNYIIGIWVGNKDASEMLGVSGATGAGDIFKKVVYALDNKETNSKIISLDKQTKNYIKIISPLDKSIYEINTGIPLKAQKIKLNFSSNLIYDKIVWYINEKIFDGEFLSIEDIGKDTIIKVEVYKDGILIGSDKVIISRK